MSNSGPSARETYLSESFLSEIRFPVSGYKDGATPSASGSGTVSLHWSGAGLLKEVRWQAQGKATSQLPLIPAGVSELVSRLRAYFDEGMPLGELPWEIVDQTGWTEFQCQVYRAITQIPHGETRTYGWVADRVRKSGACRAVGQALRNNRLPILVPCHRVVSSASLGGFMGCIDPNQPELRLKRRLIELEESYRSPMFPFLVSA